MLARRAAARFRALAAENGWLIEIFAEGGPRPSDVLGVGGGESDVGERTPWPCDDLASARPSRFGRRCCTTPKRGPAPNRLIAARMSQIGRAVPPRGPTRNVRTSVL
jgi:hypothetical protein